MNVKTLALILLSLSLFASCTESEEEVFQKQITEYQTRYTHGACGSKVISDYNSMVLKCKYLDSYYDLTECKSMLERLIKKYPTINCKAETGYGLDKKQITIRSTQLRESLSKVEEALEDY